MRAQNHHDCAAVLVHSKLTSHADEHLLMEDMEVPQHDLIMDSIRAKMLRSQTERLQRKFDKRVKKRNEKEEKRRKKILAKRKEIIDANNQRFLRDPIIVIQQGFKRTDAGHIKQEESDLLRLPNLSSKNEKVRTEITSFAAEVAKPDFTMKEIKVYTNNKVMSFPQIQKVKINEEPNIINSTLAEKDPENIDYQTSGPKLAKEEYGIEKEKVYLRNGEIKGELHHKTDEDKTLSLKEIITGRLSRGSKKTVDKAEQTAEKDPFKKDQFCQTQKVSTNHMPPLRAAKVYRNNSLDENKQNRTLSINGEPGHIMMQKLVLEEVKKVLEVDNRHEVDHKELVKVDEEKYEQSGGLSSEDSLEITIKSTTECDDNFSLESDYERPVDDDCMGNFSVGSAFDRYGDAVVVLSPVSKKISDDLTTERSISSSGMGGSCNEDVNHDSPSKKKSSRSKISSRRKKLGSKDGEKCICSCKNCQIDNAGFYKVAREDELLTCLKSLDARLQETENQMKTLQVKTAMKLINEGIIAKKKILEMCSLEALPRIGQNKLEMKSAPPSWRQAYT